MKRLTLPILVLMILTHLNAMAYEWVNINGICYNLYSDNTASVTYRYADFGSTQINFYKGAVNIPKSISHEGTVYKVTGISAEAFKNCTKLTEITIPNSITSIGGDAFQYCTALQKVTFEDGETPIVLKRLVIKNNTTGSTYYSGPLFEDSPVGELYWGRPLDYTTNNTPKPFNNGTHTLTVGQYIKEIPSLFTNFTTLTSLYLNNGVEEIDSYAFSGCSIKELILPASLKIISVGAFKNNQSLTRVKYSTGLIECHTDAFSNCRNLTTVEVPTLNDWLQISFGSKDASGLRYADGLKIGAEMLSNLDISVNNFPNVNKINSYAFSYCKGLTSVKAKNVNSIGVGAFSYCESLTSVSFDDNLTELGSSVFSECKNLGIVNLSSNTSIIGSSAFLNCAKLEGVMGLDAIATIPMSCFEGCNSLRIMPNTPDVTKIEARAFFGCTALSDIKIFGNTTQIMAEAFGECGKTNLIFSPGSEILNINDKAFQNTAVTSITLSRNLSKTTAFDNSIISSLTIQDGTLSIPEECFKNCTGLTTLQFPASLASIGSRAFTGCNNVTELIIADSEKVLKLSNSFPLLNLTSIYIGRDISCAYPAFSNLKLLKSAEFGQLCTSIQSSCFYNCTALQTVRLSNSIINIGSLAFSNCSSLESFTIPENTETIGNSAFSGCTSLKSLTIPSNVNKIEDNTFSNCTLTPLLILGNTTVSPKTFTNMSGSIICAASNYEHIKPCAFDLPLYIYNVPYQFDINRSTLSLDMLVSENPYFQSTANDINNFYLTSQKNYSSDEEQKIPIDRIGSYHLEGLELGSVYDIIVKADTYKSEDCIVFREKLSTPTPTINVNCFATLTTVQITDISIEQMDELNIKEKGIYYNNKKIEFKNGAKISGLYPATTCSYIPYIIYNNNQLYSFSSKNITTKQWKVEFKNSQSAPTSAILEASIDTSEIEPKDFWWQFNEERTERDSFIILSLDPSTYYSAQFIITYGKENKKYSFPFTFKTDQLILETLLPKCVSATSAIVAAHTNISNLEPMVGFEWKKYDAPSSLAPNRGFGAVCDDSLEGYIKNLQTTSYYNVRPFYTSASGKEYYGEWITFDPSDFSYFEPTVRTYEAWDITHNSATVRGYALSGTDNIKRQGFQYWVNGNSISDYAYSNLDNQIYTIDSSGQIMTATIENLQQSTSYIYRAFVETEAGFTYGAEKSFTTSEFSDVVLPSANQDTVVPVAYYDMSGRSYKTLQYGFNIILFSDGSTKKVVVK